MIVLVDVPIWLHHQVEISINYNFVAVKRILESVQVILPSLLLVCIDFIFSLILKYISFILGNAWVTYARKELDLFFSFQFFKASILNQKFSLIFS